MGNQPGSEIAQRELPSSSESNQYADVIHWKFQENEGLPDRDCEKLLTTLRKSTFKHNVSCRQAGAACKLNCLSLGACRHESCRHPERLSLVRCEGYS